MILENIWFCFFLLPLFELSDLWEQSDACTLRGHFSHHTQYFLCIFVSSQTPFEEFPSSQKFDSSLKNLCK